MVWSQTLSKAGDKYPFLKNATVELVIDRKYPILKSAKERFPEYESICPTPMKTIDLDVEKLYLEAKNMDEDYLREAFEGTLGIFYALGKILFGSTVKFPLVLDEEDI